MQIQTNTAALSVQRRLGEVSSGLATSLQRLSSGLRVNSARDDAAGLAISERMLTQLKGYSQAQRNLNDGVSMLSTAEGAMGNVTDILQRVRELAVQAANGTNSTSDRQALQSEVSELLLNIDDIGRRTAFNGVQLFTQTRTSIGGDAEQRGVLDSLEDWLGASVERIATWYGLRGNGADIQVNLQDPGTAGGVLASVSWSTVDANGKALDLNLNIDMADFTPLNLPSGGSSPIYNDRIIAHEMVHALMANSMNVTSGGIPNWFMEGSAEFIHGGDERVSGDLSNIAGIRAALSTDSVAASEGYSAGYLAMRFIEKNFDGGVKAVMTRLAAGDTMNQAVATASGGTYANTAALVTAVDTALGQVEGAGSTAAQKAQLVGLFDVDLDNTDTGAIGGRDASGGATLTAASVIADSGNFAGFKLVLPTVAGDPGNQTLLMQGGAETGQVQQVMLGALNIGALGIEGIDLLSGSFAGIRAVDRALNYVSSERAKLGAQLSGVEASISRLGMASENGSAARGRIIDADFAAETGTLARQQILQNAAQAMLAQANTLPRLALSLLGSAAG